MYIIQWCRKKKNMQVRVLDLCLINFLCQRVTNILNNTTYSFHINITTNLKCRHRFERGFHEQFTNTLYTIILFFVIINHYKRFCIISPNISSKRIFLTRIANRKMKKVWVTQHKSINILQFS